MSLTIRPYCANNAAAWDEFCKDALQATFLHTCRFLSYHGNRFTDCSVIIEKDGKWVGLFPAALSPTDSSCVVSHPGITYGGVLHKGQLRGASMIEALTLIKAHYAALGLSRLMYKVVPVIYHRAPAQDDLYALFRLGARRYRCDLSCTIDMQHRLQVSERRRRSLNRAIMSGVEIVEGFQYFSDLWPVLTENLASKHGAKPVHSVEEILFLANLFPGNIRCVCARVDSEIVAGVVLFITQTVYHAQYIAASKKGYETSALDKVFEHCISKASASRVRWFDFGISNENQGTLFNDGLYRFKSEFGGGGIVHEFYELELK